MTVEMEVSETRSYLRSRQQEKGREACATLVLTKLSKVNLVSREAWHFGRRRDFRCRKHPSRLQANMHSGWVNTQVNSASLESFFATGIGQ